MICECQDCGYTWEQEDIENIFCPMCQCGDIIVEEKEDEGNI
jgi:predicted Zn-ribbon and HTH transcriptional regulator